MISVYCTSVLTRANLKPCLLGNPYLLKNSIFLNNTFPASLRFQNQRFFNKFETTKNHFTTNFQNKRISHDTLYQKLSQSSIPNSAPIKVPFLGTPKLKFRLYHENPNPVEKTEYHERIITIPNILTMCRIVSSPFLGYLIVSGQYSLALYGCVIFGLTDVLDGYLARQFNMSSTVGSIIDPAADKIFISTLIVSLAYVNLLPIPLVAIFLSRDISLAVAAFYIRWKTLPKPAKNL
ncbi:hypothetical protein BB560_005535 [Smittium megazygosporum]|uniref:Uncharacterized protein n=1 Tax=Smittium megazygosporum TaxID=133381 RepID=A0A2T9Z3S2_9FUNG|nr:hypothetical protein BB560_005535 [Smittium megazygosporum]